MAIVSSHYLVENTWVVFGEYKTSHILEIETNQSYIARKSTINFWKMAEFVQLRLEEMLPEMEQMQRVQLFSEQEIK